jgi:DNA replication protein DnaC
MAEHYRSSCSCGAPSRWQGSPMSESRCFDCQYRDLAAHLPRARAEDWSWATYPRFPHLQAPYEAAREWLEEYHEGADHNLFIAGPPGVGKTGLAWCIARADLEAGGVPEFANLRRLLDDLRARISAERAGELDPEYGPPLGPDPRERLRNFYELVVLDDLAAERRTAWGIEELALLIEERYDAGHGGMVVTSNYAPAELARKLGGRRDPQAGERLVSRLLHGARRIEIAGPNLRLEEQR